MPTSVHRPRHSPWWWIAAAVSLPYAAGVFGYFAVRAFVNPWPPFFAMLAYFGPFLFAPLLLVVPLALAGRSRLALAAVVAVVALFLAVYGAFLFPRIGSPPLMGAPMQVMTFNLGPEQARPEQVVAAIARQGADIVAVQELTPPTAQRLRAELGGRYPHAILDPDVADTGLLSRYPVLSSSRFRPAGTGRQALEVALDVAGVTVHVIVAHPRPPGICWSGDGSAPTGVCYQSIDREVADVARRAALLPLPVIVLGDFNMADLSRAYESMTAVFGDSYRDAGWGFGFTFPVGLTLRGITVPGPVGRIDYVFHSGDLYVRQADVVCRGGSDHCYVVAQLQRVGSW